MEIDGILIYIYDQNFLSIYNMNTGVQLISIINYIFLIDDVDSLELMKLNKSIKVQVDIKNQLLYYISWNSNQMKVLQY